MNGSLTTDGGAPAPARQRVPLLMEFWVLRYSNRHEDSVQVEGSREDALATLAGQVRTSWDNIGGEEGVPLTPDVLADEDVVSMYFGVESSPGDSLSGSRGDESFSLYPELLGGSSGKVRLHLARSLKAEIDDDHLAVHVGGWIDSGTGQVTIEIEADTADAGRGQRPAIGVSLATG